MTNTALSHTTHIHTDGIFFQPGTLLQFCLPERGSHTSSMLGSVCSASRLSIHLCGRQAGLILIVLCCHTIFCKPGDTPQLLHCITALHNSAEQASRLHLTMLESSYSSHNGYQMSVQSQLVMSQWPHMSTCLHTSAACHAHAVLLDKASNAQI